MSTIKSTESADEIDQWITAARQFHETAIEEIKSDVQFLEWAADIVAPDIQADEGWIPGWNLDDCARKWFEHTRQHDFPPFPTRTPWDQSISLGGHREFIVTLTHETRQIPDSDLKVSLSRGLFLSYDDDRAESIADALNERPAIALMGDAEQIRTPHAARALAAALMDFADEMEARKA